MSGQDTSATHYVYDLIDPRDGTTFYVGKGRRDRRFHHLREAKSGGPSAKCDRIRDILSSGHDYTSVIIFDGLSEQDALDLEEARIAYFGLEALTNVMPKGWVYVPKRDVRPQPTVSQRFVMRDAARLRHVAELLNAGARFTFDGFDMTAYMREVIFRLCADVGQEFFSQHVGATCEPLFSIRPEWCSDAV